MQYCNSQWLVPQRGTHGNISLRLLYSCLRIIPYCNIAGGIYSRIKGIIANGNIIIIAQVIISSCQFTDKTERPVLYISIYPLCCNSQSLQIIGSKESALLSVVPIKSVPTAVPASQTRTIFQKTSVEVVKRSQFVPIEIVITLRCTRYACIGIIDQQTRCSRINSSIIVLEILDNETLGAKNPLLEAVTSNGWIGQWFQLTALISKINAIEKKQIELLSSSLFLDHKRLSLEKGGKDKHYPLNLKSFWVLA